MNILHLAALHFWNLKSRFVLLFCLPQTGVRPSSLKVRLSASVQVQVNSSRHLSIDNKRSSAEVEMDEEGVAVASQSIKQQLNN